MAVWDGTESKKWEEHKVDSIRSIKRFIDEEGRLPYKRAKVGVTYHGSCPSREDEVQLGNAVQNFQQGCKKGYMSEAVKSEAEAIPALWARIQPQSSIEAFGQSRASWDRTGPLGVHVRI